MIVDMRARLHQLCMLRYKFKAVQPFLVTFHLLVKHI
jgi:hypothetical protein